MRSSRSSDKSANIWGILAGSAIIISGAIWGFFPISGDCGAPFIPAESSNFFTAGSCSTEAVGPRVGAIVAIVVGLIVLIAAIHYFLQLADVDVDPASERDAKPTMIERDSLTSELSELARLRASGALDDDEYRIAKARALGTNRGE
ncbi:SHOCT domain-containing protein [Cryobacterium ruanii]|uniref:SHOCT domain-containing protein n=1 Tax=Cryobacterium ruanii TaxID=1259197 RepID=A0A4R9AUM5_9MICO|nr:SHOCT domain-containing protein [Cryobacterium ruanii]TFD68977.1 SHOCT domain-containing protein [Cryobacterium ruanii]